MVQTSCDSDCVDYGGYDNPLTHGHAAMVRVHGRHLHHVADKVTEQAVEHQRTMGQAVLKAEKTWPWVEGIRLSAC
jgi:hypothetical protein